MAALDMWKRGGVLEGEEVCFQLMLWLISSNLWRDELIFNTRFGILINNWNQDLMENVPVAETSPTVINTVTVT